VRAVVVIVHRIAVVVDEIVARAAWTVTPWRSDCHQPSSVNTRRMAARQLSMKRRQGCHCHDHPSNMQKRRRFGMVSGTHSLESVSRVKVTSLAATPRLGISGASSYARSSNKRKWRRTNRVKRLGLLRLSLTVDAPLRIPGEWSRE